ncbi:hypothetical protein DYB32_002953 [Aphanomyces invadans]|uniref:B30.2/SPRY domain-containing protein n=1 Tax=Aphanomyces invadans TaxID=157072 RepID=A0A418B1U6_9STRA|nr:hypothetical protein DYB32_002953 [Aphanomyces invadans]
MEKAPISPITTNSDNDPMSVQTHKVAAMTVMTETFSPSAKGTRKHERSRTSDRKTVVHAGGSSHDDSGTQSSDEDDLSVNSKFLADLKAESIHCRKQLAKQEEQFEELKKIQHASMNTILSTFTALEKKLNSHLGLLEDQSTSLLRQQHHVEELLNKDYSVASSNIEDHNQSTDPTMPPSKRSRVASPVPVRVLPPRTAPPPPALLKPLQTSKSTGKRGPRSKADNVAVHDMTPYLYPGRWDVARCGHYSEFDRNGRRLRTTSSGWNVVIGREPADAFVVRISFPTTKQKNTVAIGLTKDPSFWKEALQRPHSPLDFNQFGWFLNVQRGALCSKDGHDNTPYCTRFKTGDVLGVVLDAANSEMRFFKNGRDLGVAFHVAKRGMYPAVVTYDRGIKVEIVES